MIHHMKRNPQSALCLFAFVLLVSATFLAAPALALKVEGARIALDVEPGKTYASPIGISINNDESEGTYAIDVMGFGQSTVDGTYTALDGVQDTSPYSARTFILIDNPTVHLKPGEQADLTATITIPSGTQDGGRYAIILVHPSASASGQPAAFATAVAIPVFLTVKSGTVTMTGEISTLEPATVGTGQSFQIITTFRNTGNYHFYGAVNNVTITDEKGMVAATARTEPFSRAIIPGQTVAFRNMISTGLPQGNYLVTSRIENQDGTLLAVKMNNLKSGNPAPVRATPVPTTIPGFGAFTTLIGISVMLYGARRSGKGGPG